MSKPDFVLSSRPLTQRATSSGTVEAKKLTRLPAMYRGLPSAPRTAPT
jgi:hypothetical protein